jgi:hypothetical protein
MFTNFDLGYWKFTFAVAVGMFACAVWLALLFVISRALKFRPLLCGLTVLFTVLLIFFFSLVFPPLNRTLVSIGYRLFTGGDPVYAHWKFAPAVASWVFAYAVWLVPFFVFIHVLKSLSRPFLLGLTVLLIFIFSCVAQIAFMRPLTKSVPIRRPPVSVVQLFRFLEHLQEEKAAHGERRSLAVAMNENSGFLRRLTESHPEKARFDTVLKSVRVTENEKFDANMKTNGYDALIYFDPLPEQLFLDVSSVGENHRDMRNYLSRMERLTKRYERKGFKSLLINGGAIIYRDPATSDAAGRPESLSAPPAAPIISGVSPGH